MYRVWLEVCNQSTIIQLATDYLDHGIEVSLVPSIAMASFPHHVGEGFPTWPGNVATIALAVLAVIKLGGAD